MSDSITISIPNILLPILKKVLPKKSKDLANDYDGVIVEFGRIFVTDGIYTFEIKNTFIPYNGTLRTRLISRKDIENSSALSKIKDGRTEQELIAKPISNVNAGKRVDEILAQPMSFGNFKLDTKTLSKFDFMGPVHTSFRGEWLVLENEQYRFILKSIWEWQGEQ